MMVPRSRFSNQHSMGQQPEWNLTLKNHHITGMGFTKCHSLETITEHIQTLFTDIKPHLQEMQGFSSTEQILESSVESLLLIIHIYSAITWLCLLHIPFPNLAPDTLPFYSDLNHYLIHSVHIVYLFVNRKGVTLAEMEGVVAMQLNLMKIFFFT